MSERFSGLNLPQLVELLHDIVVPSGVSMRPETAGWKILAAWAVAAAGIAAWHGVLRWRRNRYRREAAAGLRRLEERLRMDPTAVAEIGALLKRTAITAYSRDRIAPLYGHDYADFLVRSSGDDVLVREAAEQLAAVAYRSPAEPARVIEAAHRWIRCHRA